MLFSAALRCRYSVVMLHGRRADSRRALYFLLRACS